ncbi:hypothetical protein COU91_03095 [Candidatus Saccharibacteria bacterium CG10_big_fil_rev_8_21_14_0_10_47_8]|nr:MAG: hypothetical protein COU91_03095 [Candidatus Saccharibacteria bacterium CG10_big_fil_rev_8_21_14_0_10_47_8]
MKALWKNKTIAESDDTITIEGNIYFPPHSVNHNFLEKSGFHTLCYWKGLASYYHVSDNKNRDKNIAWYYPRPTWLSKKIMGKDFSNYVAFDGRMKVTS